MLPNDLHNLRGQSSMSKPDAAILRQVDALVSDKVIPESVPTESQGSV